MLRSNKQACFVRMCILALLCQYQSVNLTFFYLDPTVLVIVFKKYGVYWKKVIVHLTVCRSFNTLKNTIVSL